MFHPAITANAKYITAIKTTKTAISKAPVPISAAAAINLLRMVSSYRLIIQPCTIKQNNYGLIVILLFSLCSAIFCTIFTNKLVVNALHFVLWLDFSAGALDKTAFHMYLLVM